MAAEKTLKLHADVDPIYFSPNFKPMVKLVEILSAEARRAKHTTEDDSDDDTLRTGVRVHALEGAVATLGGSLHAPAVPFFYVEMGLDAPAIGTLNSLSALGSLALAAPYGWLLDKRGPYTAILISSAMCGLGCLFRGLAPSYPYLVVAAIFLGLGGGNLVTLILAYVSTQTEPSQRALVVSGCAQLGARNSAHFVDAATPSPQASRPSTRRRSRR